jgi:hypothetical protein
MDIVVADHHKHGIVFEHLYRSVESERTSGSLGNSQMEQIDTFSARVRWLAIATGFASALALFPILALLYPALLIVGGIIQPRSPSAGRGLARSNCGRY